MSERKVRIGFVGCGSHATSALFPTLRTIAEIELVAVCDLKEELAKRNARFFGALRWYTDVREMLEKEELDGVIIVGPPQMHTEVGRICLDAGKPIFVEKPSAISYEEALSLARYAEERGLWGAVAYMKRYAVGYRMAKQIAESQEFGGIHFLQIEFSNGPYPAIWGIEDPAKAFLIGQAVHLFNLARFFCGEIAEVYAKLYRLSDTVFAYAIVGEFQNGIPFVMNLNSLEAKDWKIRERLCLSGNGCYLEVVDMLHLRYRPKDLPIQEFKVGGRTQLLTWTPEWTEILATKAEGAFGYRGEVEEFAKACLGEGRPASSLWDGAKDLQVAEAVWESANTRKPFALQ
ncbi:MAG: Gfo/Idh/MocA family oxidoreductase [Armatimonadota bacterium]|nr:Gfo/Idh/MocA family oxidoreductase [Armatimonadota bacterium]MDW8143252.1 Gfo/Idh/MocA family oxidoreductase [Armatimonadota bacterium]